MTAPAMTAPAALPRSTHAPARFHHCPGPPATQRAANVGITQWRALVNGFFTSLDVQPLTEPFVGTLALRTIGEVEVFDLTATPHAVQHAPSRISPGDPGYYKLSLQLSGEARLTQDGRTALIRPGDLAIYDTTRPYDLTFEQDNHAFVIMFPHRVFALPVSAVAGLTAVAFRRDTAMGRMIIPFLAELGSSLEQLPGPDGTRLVHSAIDLLGALLSSEMHVEVDPHRRLAQEIRRYVDEHLGDPDLSPSSIAREFFISTRHLHSAFSADGVTLSAWIRERRLERIRRDLTDPRYECEPLQQVAGRWGLHDAAHFSKLFRSRYGERPSDYRRRTRSDKPSARES